MTLNVHEFRGRAKHWWSEHSRDVWLAFVFAIAVAIGIEIAIDLSKDGWVGPSSYKVFLVGKLDEGQIQELFTAIETQKIELYLDGVPVHFERRPDYGEPERAKDVAQEIVADRATLAVVGHVQTQETKLALPYYMGATPQIPVIGTLETDDNLMDGCPVCEKSDWLPILQMAPTNIWQARSAARYIHDKHIRDKDKTRCVIAYDLSGGNADYAKNLLADFHSALQESDYRSIESIDWDMNGGVFPNEEFRRFKPNCAFYVGQRAKARQLITQLSLIRGNRPIMVIFPDSVVDPDVSDDTLLDNYESAAYTYPTNAAYRAAGRSEIGEDAFGIVRDLIEGADTTSPTLIERLHRFLGMHRAADARAEIIRGMKQRAAAGRPYSEIGDSYKFSGVQRENTWFHVWTIRNNKVADVDNWHPAKLLTATAGR